MSSISQAFKLLASIQYTPRRERGWEGRGEAEKISDITAVYHFQFYCVIN